ncbi:MAG: glycosyltransferase [Parcubacteria group bacterium]|jgi:glycosyltransferase involved in cell wall biosynthesis
MKSIVVVSHKFLTQPDDDLVLFLNENKYENVLHIRHSFSDAPDRKSFVIWYKNGDAYKEYKTKDYKNWPEVFIYAKEFLFTIKLIMAGKIIWDKYIGMDGLCVIFGNFLRFFGKVKKTIYWATDFVPEKRFGSGIKNKIYHWINICGYKKSDEMWDLSPRMAEAREKFLDIKKSNYKFHRVVPYGVWTERIKKYSFAECEKNTLVFMGHLLEKQGAQLIIKIIPEIIRAIPNFKFKIIGGGKYRDDLTNLAKELDVLPYCDFRGKIEDIKILENEIAKSCVAIAPYIKNLDTWTYYADPGKIKTYLACGVPVLLTEIPWNAKEIEQNKCGMIISEDSEDIKNKILALMEEKTNQEFRDNAIQYAKNFDYRNIFNTLNL